MQNLELLSREKLLELADVISHFISFDLDYNVLSYFEHGKLYTNFLDICDFLNADPVQLQSSLNAARSANSVAGNKNGELR